MLSFIPFLFCTLPLISAHFTLDFPTTRGFDEDLEPQFCGGFNTSTTRVPFPLGSASVSINSHHPTADVAIQISFQSNPTSFNQFNQTSTGTPYADLMSFGKINGQGEWCFHVDIAKLGVAGVGNGSLATIQVIFNGGDGALFQCADVVLLSTFIANSTCVNATSSSTTSQSSSYGTTTLTPGSVTITTSSTSTSGGNATAPSATSSKGSGGVRNMGVAGGVVGLMMMGLVLVV